MASLELKTSLEGKVRNLPGFRSEALLPLFEAVVNGIQAIDEKRNVADGLVEVRVVRDHPQNVLRLEESDALADINSFEIRDNGIGFTQSNYESFQTADSTYKLEIGGKGVGRFLWLKAFESVEIRSVFAENGSLQERNIAFSLKEGIAEHSRKASSSVDGTGSSVFLRNFKGEYRKLPSAYRTANKIAQRILEHCLTLFITDVAPEIILIDEGADQRISLKSLYSLIRSAIVKEEFDIDGERFAVYHVKLYDTRAQSHKLVLCGNNRDVISKSIGAQLGTNYQLDEEGRKFFYAAYVVSPYLDEHVDSFRQSFDIPEKRDLYSVGRVTTDEIVEQVLYLAKRHLEPWIEAVREGKKERLARYVQDKNPAMRAVLKYCPELIDEVEVNTSDEKLSEVLYKYKGKSELELKRESEKLLKTQAASVAEIKESYDAITSKLEEFQKDQLAGYIVLRRMVIDLLDRKLELNSKGGYSNEDIVHDVIFPRKTDTDEILYEDHNLWLIDELLAYHSLAFSDKTQLSYSANANKERPDVAVFAEATEDRRVRAVSLVEFKKPQREKFDEDPTRQLFRYVRQIRSSGVWKSNGRQLTVDDTARFYCYAVCDITKPIVEFAENSDFAALQGELGYYKYNRSLNAHVELIAFDKIVLDARQRHRAFFDHLGLVGDPS